MSLVTLQCLLTFGFQDPSTHIQYINLVEGYSGTGVFHFIFVQCRFYWPREHIEKYCFREFPDYLIKLRYGYIIINFSKFWRLESSRSRWHQILCQMTACFLLHRVLFQTFSHLWRGKGALLYFFYVGTNSIHFPRLLSHNTTT
jgi:hypothetical protein